MYVGRDWDPLDVGEVDVFTLDFVKDLNTGETIASATVACVVVAGTDATPESRLSGSASFSGTKVSQGIAGALGGVDYRLIGTVITSASRTLIRWSNFACQDPVVP